MTRQAHLLQGDQRPCDACSRLVYARGNLPWRRRRLCRWSADDPDVLRLGSLLALGDVELDLLPLLQAAVAATGDRADMHENVRTALHSDEAVAPVAVEPLHRALRHRDLLRPGPGARHHGGSPPLPQLLWPACHP